MPDVNAGWQWVVDQCNDNTVGYSQDMRNAGKDASGNTYYDCSSLMNYACLNMGFETPNYAPYSNPWVTQCMGDELTRLGWTQIGTGAECKPGDIALNPQTHTEMCYSGGYLGTAIWMGAHGRDPSMYTWDEQVSISTTARTSWEQIWRYGDGGSGGGGTTPTAKFSFAVCAAICGNWYQESGCNPGIWEGLVVRDWTWTWNEDNTGGYGLGQWTNTGGDTHGRLYQVHDYLQSNGYDADSGEGQMAFLVEENYWLNVSGYGSLNEFLNSDSDDINSMTEIFMVNWEGINDGSLGTRQEYAGYAYTYLQDHWQDNVKWRAYNNWTSTDDWYNNCVCIYQWLNLNVAGGSNSGTGGGTTSGSTGGNPQTQEGTTSSTDWYGMFLSMIGMGSGKENNLDLLIKRLRK